MSIIAFQAKRLNKNQARKLVSVISKRYPQNIRFSRHALEEIHKDKLTTGDILNVLKSSAAKIYDEAELENGSYRYRLETNAILVVLAFDTLSSLVVVTAWRKKS